MDVYEIVLKQNKGNGDQNYEALLYLTKLVLDFLKENKCIIYFYADYSPIKKSKNHSTLSNQEFRSQLFSTLFEKLKYQTIKKKGEFNYILRTTAIKDQENGNHFITLISNKDQGVEIEELTNSILAMNDK